MFIMTVGVWGRELGIRIPSKIVYALVIKKGDRYEVIKNEDGSMLFKPVKGEK